MTVSCVYDSTLSRVRVSADGLGSALTATFERSTNQITWSTVRGGLDVPITSGEAQVDDWEFEPDVVNYYRVSYASPITYVAAGTADTDNNASVTPGVPAGTTTGDTLCLFAGIRNFGTGSVNVPAGWSTVLSFGGGCAKLMAKTAGASESTPTVSFTGGVAGADTAAQMIALRGVDLESLLSTGNNVPNIGTDITTPDLDLGETWRGGEVLYLGWKADDWSGASLGTGTEISEMVSTAGSDMAMVWNHRELAESVEFDNLGEQTFTITGSTTASWLGGVAALKAATLTQTGSITPTLTQVWLKNLARPFLNRAVVVTDWSDIEQASRNGVFDIVGRSRPIAVTDVRTSRRVTLTVMADDTDDAEDLRLCLAGGDPILLHVPSDCGIPGMYAVVGDLTIARKSVKATRRFLTLPLVECNAPGPDIVGGTATYQTVVNTYATYADLLAAFATYQDVLDLIAQPAEVIVE